MNKIIRTICSFTERPTENDVHELERWSRLFEDRGFVVQTKRICVPGSRIERPDWGVVDKTILKSHGTLSFDDARRRLEELSGDGGVCFNVELANSDVTTDHVAFLFDIIRSHPSMTFNFAYVFNNAISSPFFPSAQFEREGFTIGLQPTDMAEGCNTLEAWFENMETAWKEVVDTLSDEKYFLGIDSSIAPIFGGYGSLLHYIQSLGMSFNESILSDTYLKMTQFIKEKNPKPVGLCGLMLPCLEDFELADEYEKGNFPIERNVFLSLHSGLGIDTYPIGIDEDHEMVLNILRLVRGLSNKYRKPLSVRFVSDGAAEIGGRTHFHNEYLKDVIVRKLQMG